MRKYGRRHTLPYLLSLAFEYLAFSLRQTSATRLAGTKASGPMLPNSQSEVERAETKKRARAFWWYLVRGPVWESWTKCVCCDLGVGLELMRWFVSQAAVGGHLKQVRGQAAHWVRLNVDQGLRAPHRRLLLLFVPFLSLSQSQADHSIQTRRDPLWPLH